MIHGTFLRGVDGHAVDVTATYTPGLSAFVLHGMREAMRRETVVRVRSAICNAAHPLVERFDPPAAFARRIEVFLTPNHDGTIDDVGLDLPIALALVGGWPTRNVGAVGELALSGEVRPVRGVLPRVEALARVGVEHVLVAPENAREAALVSGVKVIVVRSLTSALAFLATGEGESYANANEGVGLDVTAPNFSDVRGNEAARRALEIAAVGGHSVLLIGTPGSGKTMLARRVAGILPPMTHTEAFEVTRVHSAAGLNVGGGLVTVRPFRAPHHSTTPPGLVGGGTALAMRPGEVSLAHNGVLFLDEVQEFAVAALAALGEVLRAGSARLARSNATCVMPARPSIVIATATPCPCGRPARCRCGDDVRKRYAERLKRIVDTLGITMIVHVDDVDLRTLDTAPPGEPSGAMRDRVEQARKALVEHVRASTTISDLATDGARAVIADAAKVMPPARLDAAMAVAWTLHAHDARNTNASRLPLSEDTVRAAIQWTQTREVTH